MDARSVIRIPAAILAVALASQADAQNYSFQFVDTSNNVLAQGTFVTDPVVNTISPGGLGPFQSNTITSATGTYLGQTFTFVPNANAPGPATVGQMVFDNQLLLNAGLLLDPFGIGLTAPNAPGDMTVNIFGAPGQGGYLLATNAQLILGTFSVSAIPSEVPEPATWITILLGFGTAGVAFRARPRQRRAAA